MRLLLITPARDEESHLRAVAEAVARQTLAPSRWLIVDDGSRDRTPAIAREIAASLPFVGVLEAPAPAVGSDPLGAGSEARAFAWAHASEEAAYDGVGKLDADIVLPLDHLERMAGELEADPRLGIVGCPIVELRDGRWRVEPIPPYHVHGAVKLYREACLRAIGGIRPTLGWDTLDELAARRAGWRTATVADAQPARHLRPSASAAGVLRGRARHGACAWILGYPPWLVAARAAARELPKSPPLLGAAAYLGGYVRAGLRRTPRDEELCAHSRREQRARARRALERLFRPGRR